MVLAEGQSGMLPVKTLSPPTFFHRAAHEGRKDRLELRAGDYHGRVKRSITYCWPGALA
jgi:hypothetical protein